MITGQSKIQCWGFVIWTFCNLDFINVVWFSKGHVVDDIPDKAIVLNINKTGLFKVRTFLSGFQMIELPHFRSPLYSQLMKFKCSNFRSHLNNSNAFTKMHINLNNKFTNDVAQRGGLIFLWPKCLKLRQVPKAQGIGLWQREEGWLKKSKCAWRHLWTAPNQNVLMTKPKHIWFSLIASIAFTTYIWPGLNPKKLFWH